MVNYLNSEVCNTLGNLLNRCTSKSINSSQTFPPLNTEFYESVATQEGRQLINDLQQLPGLLYLNTIGRLYCSYNTYLL